MSSDPRDRVFPHLDDLRRAYDRDASYRNSIGDLQWRTGALEAWLQGFPEAPRLLELGPGTGQLALHAKGLGADVHAIDLSFENVTYCRQRGIQADVGDFRDLRHLERLGLFDGVYSVNALLHVPRGEHAAVIAGARERLVPGGRLLIVNWGGRDWEGIWADDRCDPPRFFSHYDDRMFSELTFDGFEVIRREVLAVRAPDGLQPQLLAMRSVPITREACS